MTFYRVLQDVGGYHVGDILDLGDAEMATQIGQLVPLLKLARRPEPEAKPPALIIASVDAPVVVMVVKPPTQPKRRKRG
jgi:hypothetical protein